MVQKSLFLRATVDPEADIQRGFSGVHNSWINSLDEKEDAIEEAYPDGCSDLPEPRQDSVTGWWCWQPENGLSAFAFHDSSSYQEAMKRVANYGRHLGCVALFAASDYDARLGADGEDLFRNGQFLGWLDLGADYGDVENLLKAHGMQVLAQDEGSAYKP
jgi:hypothetical protein